MSPFRVGVTLIAGRYRLVRFIAQGGMGEVYEAFDEELRQRVAMKIVRRDVSANPVAMERFKREISLARRVSHPNVSRIFEYGRHTDPDGAVTFLTMELLDGPTLEDRIRRDGPLTTAEALPLVEQMCEGLAAAHEAGVVHRDFKSSNVILAKSPDGGVRVVLTDFGLARALTGDDAATITLTATDLMVGTPAYMSPEQAQGFELTARSDLYSLGVVLFEMVTGRFPHAGTTPMAILMSRLKEPPPSPLVVMPALDPAWDGVIRRCLEVKADRRFESARDVARALRGEAVPGPPVLTHDELPRPSAEAPARPALPATDRRRAVLAGILAAIVLAALGMALLRNRGNAAAKGGGRRSAAVLGFKNLSGRPDAAWLSTALSEMLTAELGAGEALRTVPGETVARARAELALPDADALAPATLAKVGSVLGTDLVVLGSYYASSPDTAAPLRVDLRLQGAGAGGLDTVITETGTSGQVLVLVASLGRKLRARLNVPEASAAQVETARAAFPESAEAQRLYAEGLSRLRSFDLVEARKLLEEAADASPKSPIIRSALASCFTALGDDAHALAAAQAAFDLSGSLTREERLLVEAQLAEAKKEWPKAVEDYHALFRFFPDDVEHALRLAAAETASGKAAEALATIDQAKKLVRDPRLALAEGAAQMALSHYKAALASARRAVDAGMESGARLILAQGRMLEGDALLRLGDHKGASAALETARRLFADTGDRSAEARAINRIANVAFEEGDYERASEGFKKAGDRWKDAGNRQGWAAALANVADVYEITGQFAQAEPLFRSSLEAAESLGNVRSEIIAQGNIAFLEILRGDPIRGLSRADAAIEHGRAARLQYELLVNFLARIQALIYFGRLTEAQRTVVEGQGLARAMEDRRLDAYFWHFLGEIATAMDDLPAAQRDLEQALALRRNLKARAESIETLALLGEISRLSGHPRGGLAPLREALSAARALSLADDEMAAAARLARAAIAAGEKQEALALETSIEARASTTQHVPRRFLARIALAEIAAARGDRTTARKALEQIAAEAQRSGFALLNGEARLVLGRLEARKPALQSLAGEAEGRGFRLLAREAIAAMP